MSGLHIKTVIETKNYELTRFSVMCGCCDHKGPMYLVSKGSGIEIAESNEGNDERIEAYAYYDWYNLICVSCNALNIIQQSAHEFDRDPYDDAIPTKTKHLYPHIDMSIPTPHKLMPEDIRRDYEEARMVLLISPRSSAALLRLAVQKICKELGEKGKRINEDIKNIVSRGLPIHIQQALDIVRIIGNGAVHPGQVDLRDDLNTAKELFNLINEIIEDRIAAKQKQAIINEMYNELPESTLKGIEDRDQKPS